MRSAAEALPLALLAHGRVDDGTVFPRKKCQEHIERLDASGTQIPPAHRDSPPNNSVVALTLCQHLTAWELIKHGFKRPCPTQGSNGP